MAKGTNSSGKYVALGIIVVCLALSLVFSVYSFTGYVAAEEVNNSYNAIALVLFLSGLAGSYFFLRQKR